MFAVLPVRQYFWRINGKYIINILCALCAPACPMKSLLNLFHRGGEYKYQVRQSLPVSRRGGDVRQAGFLVE